MKNVRLWQKRLGTVPESMSDMSDASSFYLSLWSARWKMDWIALPGMGVAGNGWRSACGMDWITLPGMGCVSNGFISGFDGILSLENPGSICMPIPFWMEVVCADGLDSFARLGGSEYRLLFLD